MPDARCTRPRALGSLRLRPFERVTRLDPDSSEAHYQLGRVYVRLKRASEAQRELDRFKQLSDAQKEKRETDRRDLLRRLANVRF